MATFETLLYDDHLAAGTDKINANFAKLMNSPTNGYGVASVAILPSLPDPDYPDGSIVFLTADGKLYKNFEGAWQPVVQAVDIEGQITAGQIEDGALNIAKFAANLKPPILVETLPSLPDASYGEDTLVVYDGKLYKNESDTWVAVVNTADLEGTISSTQIATGAITETKIADGSITTPKIYAGAVTTDRLAALSVTAAKLSADSVTADKIFANAVTSAKIQAGAVGTDQLAANSVTAAKMRIGSSQNMIINPEWLDGVTQPWTMTAGASVVTAASNMPGSRVASISADGATYRSIASNRFAVSAGEVYYVQADTYFYWTGFEILLQCFDNTGTAFAWQIVYSGSNPSWTQAYGQVTIPSGAREAQFICQATPAALSGRYAYMTNPRVIRAGEGQLIVDGAITATKISAGAIETGKLAAGSVTADKIAANAVTTDKLDANSVTAGKIAANSIETEHLSSKSVTAGKMVLSDTSNMALNPAFAGGDSGGWSLPSGNTTIYQSTAGVAAINYYGRITTGTTNKDFYNGEYFPVTPGETYYVSMWVYRSSSNGTFRAGINLQAADGSAKGWHTAFTAPTSLTNNTWTQFEGYVTVPAGKYFGRLWGGAVSNASPTGYWNFTNLIVRKATDTRLLVDGAIELTNADKTNAALSVKNSGGTEVLRLGNITSKAGVPSGTKFGLWGALGTGVFIQGAPRVIDVQLKTVTLSFGSVAANTYYVQTVGTIVRNSTTVPTGRKWLVMTTLNSIIPGANVASLVTLDSYGRGRLSGVNTDVILPAGSYTDIQLNTTVAIRTWATNANLSYTAKVIVLIIEVDA